MSRNLGFLLVPLVLVGCEGASPNSSSAQSATTAASPAQVEASRRTAITAAVTRVAPAVVTVQTEAVERVTDFFFGRTVERTRPGLGSGFIVSTERVSAETGIETDDVLLQINNARISSAEDAARAINYFAGRAVIEVWFERNGQLGHTYFRVR